VIKKEKIGLLIVGKKPKSSRRELLTTADILSRGNFDVTIFGRENGKSKTRSSKGGIKFIKLGRIANHYDFNASLKFTQVLKKKGITTIIFREPKATNLLVTSKFLMKGKLRLIFVQDRHLSDMNSNFLHTFRFNQIDAWITPMNQTANGVKSGTNLSLDKIHVLPLPIPKKPFSFDQEEQRLRKSVLFNDPEAIVVGWNIPDDLNLIQRTGRTLLQLLRSVNDICICINAKQRRLEQFFIEIPELSLFRKRIQSTPFDPFDADMYAHLDALFVDPALEPFSGITRRALMAGVVPIAPKSLVSDERS
jgi:hypothetical protein